ncbi:MAG: cation:proton antiporter [Alphaproteobacteria bacterium]|nr:cation:proton antiporter [Alphaproteobacteria bacterium]
MHGLHPLIVDLTLITIYAAITTLLFKKLKQPMVLGYLLAGIFAGPYFNFVPTVTDRANLSLWADIGVIFLLFSLGLEFSFKKMMAVGKSAIITATLNIFLMLFVGYYVGMLIGWTTTDSFFLGSMISMSSTTIIIKAFDDLNIKKQKFTDLVFGVLVIEDIAGILMLVLLPAVAAGHGINGSEIGLSILKLSAFLILCFVTGIYLIPTALRKLKDFVNDEMLLLVAVALCLSMVFLAVYFGFSSALGAFIMGSILSETGVIERVEHIIKPLKDFFGAVFFVTVGMMVNPQMFVTYAYPIFVITMLVLCGKVIFSTSGFVISGQNLKSAISGAFSLAQVGEFAFIIATLGMSLGVIDSFVYPIIVAVSVITTFLTPIMIKSASKARKRLEHILPEKWLTFINQNAKSHQTASEEESLWMDLFKISFIRAFVFSFILAAIIVVVNLWIRPYISAWLPNLAARAVTTLIALLLMSPFLTGLVGRNVLPSLTAENLKTALAKASTSPKLKIGQKVWSSAAFAKIKELCAKISVPEKLKSRDIFGFIKKHLPTSKSAETAPKTVKKHVFMMPQHLKTVIQENTDTVKDSVKNIISKDRISQIYTTLWFANKSNRPSLLILTSFRLLIVSFFIVTAVHQFLTENPKFIFLMLLASIWLLMHSKWLLKQYIKIESRFLDNLNGDSIDEENKE